MNSLEVLKLPLAKRSWAAPTTPVHGRNSLNTHSTSIHPIN